MKVKQFNGVKNQFVIMDKDGNEYFQSYDSMIAMKDFYGRIYLDPVYWNYSRTTSKHRNAFLGMTTKEIKEGIDSGFIIMENLN